MYNTWESATRNLAGNLGQHLFLVLAGSEALPFISLHATYLHAPSRRHDRSQRGCSPRRDRDTEPIDSVILQCSLLMLLLLKRAQIQTLKRKNILLLYHVGRGRGR